MSPVLPATSLNTRIPITVVWVFLLFLLVDGAVWAKDEPGTKSGVTFIQITDAHIFDDGYQQATSGAFRIAADDREALSWAVSEVNHLAASGRHIDFVVFTGDLGLQNVDVPPECGATPVPFLPGQPPVRFASAVQELTNELRRLVVKTIYFVPGNNDVIDEKITDMARYTCLLNELQKQMSAGAEPTTIVPLDANMSFHVGGVTFSGLNTAMIKQRANYEDICQRKDKGTARIQNSCPGEQIATLRRFVDPNAKGPFAVFTHVPDLMDPYKKAPSWELSADLRRQWEDEACRPNVIGIFAGHFHDSNRAYYGTTTGSQLLSVAPCVAQRTWVTPPLAAKNQLDKNPQARGFSLITIDASRGVRGEVHWYEHSEHSPVKQRQPCREIVIVAIALLVLAALILLAWLAYVKEGAMFDRDLKGWLAVLLFLGLSLATLWLAKTQLGLSESVTQVGLLILLLLVYGIASGRLTEFSGPGGWGAKFHEVAASSVALIATDANKLDLTNTEMQNIPKTGLAEIANKVQSITPEKGVSLSLTVGRGSDYYSSWALQGAMQSLMRFPNFKFVLFLDRDGTLVSYMPVQALFAQLSNPGMPDQPGTTAKLIKCVNDGDSACVRDFPGMIRKTVATTASNTEALEAMESIGLDAIVVRDAVGMPRGVVERGRIVSKMLSALAKGEN